MLSYYFQLKKDREDLSFDKNINLSHAIQEVAQRSFSPFKTYLKNAIENAKKKNNIKAQWKKMGTPVRIEPIGVFYKVPNTKDLYQIIPPEGESIESFKSEEMFATLKGGGRKRLPVSAEARRKGVIRLEEDISIFNTITWEGEPVKLIPLGGKETQPTGSICIEKTTEYSVFYSERELKEEENYEKIDKITPYIDFDALCYETGEAFKAMHLDKRNFLLNDEKDIGKVLLCNELKFVIKEDFGKNKYWIQLSEIEEESEKSVLEKSPLSYFFDDDMSVTDLNGNKYKIEKGDEEESRIILKKGNNNCFPETPIIQTEVNTYQLEKEAEAICTLMNMPVGEQRGLIRLFEDRDEVRWRDLSKNSKADSEISWEVLTSEDYDGCKEQRTFVKQALKTPDFAILEGPPGSGKTTVILELICQLAQQGKRILLCGSTHIAIDNILERLNEGDDQHKLLKKWNILPVRIGDEKRINEDVKEFQIDRLIQKYHIPEETLLDIANLVCGTTIGILQHPHFKGRKGKLELKKERLDYYTTTPILPEFDYLIIDESSKTTFQEFLVPALYAKKWILVGDIKQLSPFCEREEIVSNIRQLEQMPAPLQSAIFLLQKLKSCFHSKYNKFILPASYEEIVAIIEELQEGRIKDFTEKIFCIIIDDLNIEEYTSQHILIRQLSKVSQLELSVCDVLLVAQEVWETLWERYPHLIPHTHSVLFKEDWGATEHAFLHNNYQQNHLFSYKEKDKTYTDSFEIAEQLTNYFTSRNWAEEIAWRIDREHQLRMVEKKNSRQSYQKALSELMPLSIKGNKIEEYINSIASIAFPSILESLVKGIGVSYNNNSSIVKGLKEEILKEKHTILSFQHRMHPNISAFPRNQFYNDEALKDSHKVLSNRHWDYKQYPQHNVWIHIEGNVIRNKNKEEVSRLIEELKKFLLYAREQPHPEGKKWEVACLTFYRGQETLLREQLQKLTNLPNAFSSFTDHKGRYPIHIKLHTVDKFQGHEADIVFLSMVQNKRIGFLDNPNRLNVAITRAKYQLVILGNADYFTKQTQSEDLKKLAQYYGSYL